MLLYAEKVPYTAAVAQIREWLEAAEWTDGRETVDPQDPRVKRIRQLPDASAPRAEMEVLADCARAPPVVPRRHAICEDPAVLLDAITKK